VDGSNIDYKMVLLLLWQVNKFSKTAQGAAAIKAAKEKPVDEDILGDFPKVKVEKEDGEPMDGKNWETHDARKFINNFHAAIPSKVCMVRFFVLFNSLN